MYFCIRSRSVSAHPGQRCGGSGANPGNAGCKAGTHTKNPEKYTELGHVGVIGDFFFFAKDDWLLYRCKLLTIQ